MTTSMAWRVTLGSQAKRWSGESPKALPVRKVDKPFGRGIPPSRLDRPTSKTSKTARSQPLYHLEMGLIIRDTSTQCNALQCCLLALAMTPKDPTHDSPKPRLQNPEENVSIREFPISLCRNKFASHTPCRSRRWIASHAG